MLSPMPLLTLAETLDAWRRHPRAVPWRVHYHFGYGRAAPQRTFRWFAPADAGGAQAVLTRLHNGILFLQPLRVSLESPLPEARLSPWLEAIRQVHALPISVGEDEHSEPGPGEPQDLPARQQSLADGGRGLAVGLDIGGTGMKACAVWGDRVLRQAQSATWPDGEHGLDSLVLRARALVLEVCDGVRPTSLGIGLASPMGVQGQVVSLSTVMRERLGSAASLEALPSLVAAGLVDGPVSIFNDLANLGRLLSGRGRRRLLRLQLGTSFGGCWVDADGTVAAAELGRLVVDLSDTARPHTYLPLQGAMKSYLSNYGVAESLSAGAEAPVTAADAGFVWRDLVRSGDPRGRSLVAWTGTLLAGVIREALAVLPGLEEIELGGGMLQGPTGRAVAQDVEQRLKALRQPPRFAVSANPGFDGAIAAAQGPLTGATLRGVRRLVS